MMSADVSATYGNNINSQDFSSLGFQEVDDGDHDGDGDASETLAYVDFNDNTAAATAAATTTTTTKRTRTRQSSGSATNTNITSSSLRQKLRNGTFNVDASAIMASSTSRRSVGSSSSSSQQQQQQQQSEGGGGWKIRRHSGTQDHLLQQEQEQQMRRRRRSSGDGCCGGIDGTASSSRSGSFVSHSTLSIGSGGSGNNNGGTNSNHHQQTRNSTTATASSLRASSVRQSVNQVLKELTINKLQYQNLVVVGRDQELQQLQNCIERCRRSTTTAAAATTTTFFDNSDRSTWSSTSRSRNNGNNNNKNNNKIQTTKELVFIDGYSGVGKSALVSALQQQQQQQCQGQGRQASTNTNITSRNNNNNLNNNMMVMVQGKFDSNNNDVPYSGLVDALGDLCWKIAFDIEFLVPTNKILDADKLGQRIKDNSSLGSSEIRLLIKLIPELEFIIPEGTDDLGSDGTSSISVSSTKTESDKNFGADFERLKYALRVFTRILSSFFSPLVLVLDDLQWADKSSLEAIDYLLSDVENKNGLVIIGLYRSNEVDDGHPLKEKIRELQTKQESAGFYTTEISLGNLQVGDINRMIMTMLDVDDEDGPTKELAQIFYKKTYGNPFFVISFLTMLEEEGFITYNLGLLKWVWDVAEIEKETMSTENVVDLLRARMTKLSNDLQLMLQFASCLRSPFKLPTIKILWVEKSKHTKTALNPFDPGPFLDSLQKPIDRSVDAVVPLLEKLEALSFLEHSGNYTYQWIHDKVQEAAQSLGDASQASFQFDLGMKLLHGLDDRQLNDEIFDVVNLINKGDGRKSLELSVLNLKAAEKARSISAFQSASTYASYGIRLLPNDSWKAYRDITLRLYSLRSETAVALGDEAVIDECTREVLSRQDLSVLEKIPIYMTRLHKLAYLDMRYDATVERCLMILKELDCSLPTGPGLPFRAARSYLRTLRKVKQIRILSSYFDYDNPKKIADPKLKAAMMILSRLFYALAHTQSPFLLVLCACRMVETTLKYGVSPVSGYAYAAFGMLHMAATGDIQLSSSLAGTALLVDKSAASKYHRCTTINMCYGMLLPHTTLLPKCKKELANCEIESFRAGNVEIAVWTGFVLLVQLPGIMGSPIPPIDTYLSVIAQMEDLKQTEQAILTRAYTQVLLNLGGSSTTTTSLKGNVFDVDEFEPTTPNQVTFLGYLQADLFLFFGEYQLAAESALKRREEFGKAWVCSASSMVETFHRAVALYAMARRCSCSGRRNGRKYRRPAELLRKRIRKWHAGGNPNLKHSVMLLDAEHASVCVGKFQVAAKLYQDAIVVAARTGHLHHAGLFNERYADFLKTCLHDAEEAKYRIDESIRWYTEWGAMAVVNRLQSYKY